MSILIRVFSIIFSFLMVLSSCSKPSSEYQLIGKLKSKGTEEISSSAISIGGETLDRDYANYHEYKGYLDTLGAKKIRLQGGWAKTEKEKGVYDWAWLDSIIYDIVDRDIQPWLQTSYGNPIYVGGGVANLSGGMPSSPEALDAWDNWVDAMAGRYKDHVKIWEVWNEPDHGSSDTPVEDYVELYIRTTEIIRKHIPDAKLYALSLSGPYRTEYTRAFLDALKEKEKLDLVDEITFHGYVKNPSDAYERLIPLKKLVDSYQTGILLHQGEQGCPSTYLESGALREYPWTETSQYKWALRRMIGDLGNGYQTLYFTMVDLNYGDNTTTHIKNVNTKGLLKTNKANEVVAVKPSYHAVQNLIAVMDSSFRHMDEVKYEASIDSSYSVYGFRQVDTDHQVVALWFDGEIPSDTTDYRQVDFQFANIRFTDPVYIDLSNGNVYGIPTTQWANREQGSTFQDVSLTDSPVLLAERSLITTQ